jgi:hypothetical protein
MYKEEILERNRKEHKNQDLAEMEFLKQASKIAYIVGCIACVIICTLQWSFRKP